MGIIEAARELRSVEGENVEYDKALVELTAHVLGCATDEARPYIEMLILDRASSSTASAVEADVRARIVADIEALEHDRAMVAKHVQAGISPEACDAQDEMVRAAADIARGAR